MAPRLPVFFFWMFVAIALSTVLIRIHYALDIVGGLLLSELIIRAVFQPLHKTGMVGKRADEILATIEKTS